MPHMRQLKADPHMMAAQLGILLKSQAPVEVRLPLVNQLESLLIQ